MNITSINNERQLAIVEGSDEFIQSTLSELCQFIIDDTNYQTFNKSQGHLGHSYTSVGYNAVHRTNPEILSSLIGLVEDGGWLFIGTRNLAEMTQEHLYHDEDQLRYKADKKSRLNNYYLQRLVKMIQEYNQVHYINTQTDLSEIKIPPVQAGLDPSQVKLEPEIQQFLDDTSYRVLILTGKRGSGKSTRLANLARQLQQQRKPIVLTGSSKNTVEKILQFNETLSFNSLDNLPPVDENSITIIDEAATLPLPKLNELCHRGGRYILATTTEGYEGSASGFSLKFTPHLESEHIKYLHCRLAKSFRFSNDHLGKFWQKLFCPCDATAQDRENENITVPATLSKIPKDENTQVVFRKRSIEASELMQNEELLERVYGLLSSTHYRTSPSDLRQILDNPLNRLYILEDQHQQILGVLWGVIEEVPAKLVGDIFLNKRRPKGNLIPQTLVAHAGYKNAGFYRYFRTVRIAVEGSKRRLGLGSSLLAFAEEESREIADFWGVSFGISPDLLAFWDQNGYLSVKLGVKEDAASGLFSVVMLKTFGKLKGLVLQDWYDQFISEFLISSQWHYQNLNINCLRTLIAHNVTANPLDANYIRNLISLSEGGRVFEQALGTVMRFLVENTNLWLKWNRETQNDLLGYFILHQISKDPQRQSNMKKQLKESMHKFLKDNNLE